MSQGASVKLTNLLEYGLHPFVVMPQNIDVFYDLTTGKELDEPQYPINVTVNRYPIPDRKSMNIDKLDEIVNNIKKELANNKHVYIFCKGGHGRSGMVAAAVYGNLNKLNGPQAMSHVHNEWKKQRDMTKIRPNIRKLGSPQTKVQKTAVTTYLHNLQSSDNLDHQ